MPFVFAQPHFRFIDRDLNEPRAELGLLAKLPQSLECLQHRLLSHLFCVGIVFHDRYGGKKHRPLVRPDQFVKSFGITGLHPLYEALFQHVYHLRRGPCIVRDSRSARQHHAFSQCARHSFSPSVADL